LKQKKKAESDGSSSKGDDISSMIKQNGESDDNLDIDDESNNIPVQQHKFNNRTKKISKNLKKDYHKN